jgi:hypothetical protein
MQGLSSKYSAVGDQRSSVLQVAEGRLLSSAMSDSAITVPLEANTLYEAQFMFRFFRQVGASAAGLKFNFNNTATFDSGLLDGAVSINSAYSSLDLHITPDNASPDYVQNPLALGIQYRYSAIGFIHTTAAGDWTMEWGAVASVTTALGLATGSFMTVRKIGSH